MSHNNNPFVPTPYGHWNSQLYPNVNLNQQNGGQGSPSPSPSPAPTPTPHQQMQMEAQNHLYNVGYSAYPSPFLQAVNVNPNQQSQILLSQPWDNRGNGGGMQMNYSYQNVAPQYQNQHQQIFHPHMMPQPQLVTQASRMAPLPISSHNLVHFPVNLTSSASSVSPTPMNLIHSPSPSSSSSGHSSAPHSHSSRSSGERHTTTPASSFHSRLPSSPSPSPNPQLLFNPADDRNKFLAHLADDRNKLFLANAVEDRNKFIAHQQVDDRNKLFLANLVDDRGKFLTNSSDDRNKFLTQMTDNRSKFMTYPSDERNKFLASPPYVSPPKPSKKTPTRPLPLPVVSSHSMQFSPQQTSPLPHSPQGMPLIFSSSSSSIPTASLKQSSPLITTRANTWSTGLPDPMLVSPNFPITMPSNSLGRSFEIQQHFLPVSSSQAQIFSERILHYQNPPHAHPGTPMVLPVSKNQSRATSVIQKTMHVPAPPPSPIANSPRMKSSDTAHQQQPLRPSPSATPSIQHRYNAPTPTLQQIPICSPPPVAGPTIGVTSSPPNFAQNSAKSIPNTVKEELSQVNLFPDEELLKLVREPAVKNSTPDGRDSNRQSPTKSPIAETKHSPQRKNRLSINSWEQDAFNLTAATIGGDEDDLEVELRRFYCPPSPPSKNKNAASQSSSTNSASSKSAAPPAKSLSSDSTAKSPPDIKPVISSVVGSSSNSKSTKLSLETIVLSSDEEDSCKVVMVKYNKKRKVAGQRGSPVKNQPLSNSRGRGRGRGATVQNSAAKSRGPVRSLEYPHVDSEGKAICRPGFSTGRYVQVAPKSTVGPPVASSPVGPEISIRIVKAPRGGNRGRGRGGRKNVAAASAQELEEPWTLTARKSIIEPTVTEKSSVQQTPKVSKGTARKSTAPLPKSISQPKRILTLKPSNELEIPDSLSCQRVLTPIASPVDDGPKIVETMSIATRASTARGRTRQQAKTNNQVSCPKVVLQRILKTEGSTSRRSRSPSSEDTPLASAKNLRSRKRIIESSESDKSPHSSPTGSQSATSYTPKPITEKQHRKLGSDDDLTILDEVRADSDNDSFDMEGERDEASSESEDGHEPDDDEDTNSGTTPSENSTVESYNHTLTAVANDKACSEEITSTTTTSLRKDSSDPQVAESCSNDDDESSVDSTECTVQEIFHMPKPTVITKGTKEEADKAVSNLRNALAQLSKNNFLTSLFKR